VAELGHEIAHGQWSHGQWSLVESRQSSTWRELKGEEQVLRSFVVKLAGHRVKWFTENQNVVRIVQSGSCRQHLQDGAMTIFEACLANNIRLDVAWIPRSLNDKADFWQLCPLVFCHLDAMWGPHTIDRVALYYNTQLACFDSHFWDPHCEADIIIGDLQHADTRSWSGEVNWGSSTVCSLLNVTTC